MHHTPASSQSLRFYHTHMALPYEHSQRITPISLFALQLNLKTESLNLFINLELPVASPLIYASLRITEAWLNSTLVSLDAFPSSPPDNFIPGCFPNPGASGPAIEKYKSLFQQQNTPFKYVK